MSAKRNLFLGLLIGLVLGGALPAFLSFHGWTSAQDSRQVLLRQGWNQLVWTADNQPAAYAFADIVDDLAIVYGWQGDSQTFSRYIPGGGDLSTMTMLLKDSGYWLLAKRDVFLTMPASAGACPQPTACPSPPASAECGECASAFASCVSALDDCDEAFTGMADLLDDCQADVTFWLNEASLQQAKAIHWESEATFWQVSMCYGGLCCGYCY